AGDRRHCDTQEGHAFGGSSPAICFGAGQDRQLPDPGVADACAGRSACDAGAAAVSSRGLGEQSSSAEASGVKGPGGKNWRGFVGLMGLWSARGCAEAGRGTRRETHHPWSLRRAFPTITFVAAPVEIEI